MSLYQCRLINLLEGTDTFQWCFIKVMYDSYYMPVAGANR